MHSPNRSQLALAALLSAATLGFANLASAADACVVQSASTVAPVVELYTSEGCNSCPPADRWLSSLKSDKGIVALSFHVDYWDRLGWKDRFASPAFTQRQSQELSRNGADFSYTPQVVVDGRDARHWNSYTRPSDQVRRGSSVEIVVAKDKDLYTAIVTPKSEAPKRLEAFWAVTEDGHRSQVKAGENKGVTLNHDFVVREYVPVSQWNSAERESIRLQFTPSHLEDPGHRRHINLVVRDAASGRPVQAVKVGC